MRSSKPTIRRSSTNRSIGNRSDISNHSDGDEEAIHEDTAPVSRSNSIGALDGDALRRRMEDDSHVANYVTNQLERLRTNGSTVHDEFEAQLDGA